MKPTNATTPFGNDSTRLFASAADVGRGKIETSSSLVERKLRYSPELAANRSLVIEMVVDEYQQLRKRENPPALEAYCRKFSFLSSSLQSSIFRELEVEQFVSQTPWVQQRLLGDPWPKAGDQRGSFRITEELGRGALSRVYLCTQPDLGHRQVVVKVGRRSVAEADTLGRLAHPHIVPILSVERDVDHDVTMLCMPFLGRSTLYDLFALGDEHRSPTLAEAAAVWQQSSDRIESHLLPPDPDSRATWFEVVAYVGARLAGALAHSHRRGIVHGDIKPSNILLARNGAPLLMDFNLSGNLASATVAYGGTIPYMPPEQLRSVALGDVRAGRYDYQSDLYSLGVVLYEAISGRLPFKCRADVDDSQALAQEMLAQQREGPPPLARIVPRVPATLARTIERCLSFDPANRLPTAEVLQQALQRELAFRRRWSRKAAAHPHLLMGGTLLASLLFACGAYAWATQPPVEVQYFETAMALQAEDRLVEAKDALEDALDIRPDFAEARFALGRNAIARNELDQAQYAFKRVEDLERSIRSAAYRGYCWSLVGSISVAIPFYELAIERGCDAPEVHNNLGLAYQFGRTWRSEREQMQEAERQLRRALEQLPDSPTVKFNWLQLAVNRRQYFGGEYDAAALELCRELLQEYPDCGPLHVRAASFCRELCGTSPALRDEGVEHLIAAVRLGYGPDSRDLEDNPAWDAFRKSPRFTALEAIVAAGKAPRSGSRIAVTLEPVSVVAQSTGTISSPSESLNNAGQP